MALTTPLPEVPESRAMLSTGLQQVTLLVIPGTSDYTTGGWSISALNCRLQRIVSVSVDGINATGNNLGYSFTPVLAMTLSSANSLGLPPTSFLLYAYNVAGTPGIITQAANGTNFAGAIITITVTGY